ncbi:hypothetical protein [Rhizobium ruizarguesonis]|jgi:hypothetical protein|uniref:hypothetical protein n=1 Tax=Rhizobium ruizarguesonis TaxID=2081791 RepID=UPI001031D86F|nr:hypothetical protein [Rhizobium ruizarguesonis]NEI29661.1 hypothetical protein [Rhizobium ruizarguesonis]TBB91902.1 hypothetical protein ELH38_07315 [Rhizobium ruizarguesonis]
MARRKGKPVSAHLRGLGAGDGVGVGIDGDDVTVAYRDWSKEGLIQSIRINLFPQAPELVAPCAIFLFERGAERRPTTRRKYPEKLKYFSRFLSAYCASYGIDVTEYSDLSSALMAEYLSWLRGTGGVIPRVNGSGGLSKLTAAGYYRFARDLILFVKTSEEFGHLVPQAIVFNENPSDKGYREIDSVSGLSEDHIVAIRQACFAELDLTFALLKEGQAIKVKHLLVPPLHSPGKEFKPLDVCVSAYRQVESLRISQAEFRHRFPGLRRAINGPPYHDRGSVLRRLHFTRRSIVPVVILLQMHFAFEPDTLLGLNWSDEEDSFLYGHNRGKLTGTKYRGGFSRKSKPYARRDKLKYSPGALLSMLRGVTPDAAGYIGNCDRIFCYARRDGSFGTFSSSSVFTNALSEFIRDNQLRHFNLSNLRQTGADIIAKVTGGDVAEQKTFLRHKTVNTTLKSYQSPGSVARREDGLAHGMNVRARRIKSNGKIETRGASLSGQQRLGATLGFNCLDPYDSPRTGEIKGQLCGAYGRCATCPFSLVDISNARDCARLRQLQERLLEARREMDPSRWVSHWAAELEALEDVWLPAFSLDARNAAAELALPPIPEIE